MSCWITAHPSCADVKVRALSWSLFFDSPGSIRGPSLHVLPPSSEKKSGVGMELVMANQPCVLSQNPNGKMFPLSKDFEGAVKVPSVHVTPPSTVWNIAMAPPS